VTIEQRFGEGEPLSIGIEEELMILDAETLDQVGAVATLLRDTEGHSLPGVLKTELFASVFELNTAPATSVESAGEALIALRRLAATAADRNGLAIAAGGTHPFARPEDQPVVDEERYTSFVGYGGISARRQGVQGLHVHVAMPTAQACWSALETMLPWLPLILAVSANSPWLAGRLTGMASNRAPVLAELPRAGAPPAFGSYAGWEAWVERLTTTGVTRDYTRIWWDIRPHPRFGTLEVRMPDQPTRVEWTIALAAAIRTLAAWALEQEPAPVDPGRRGDYAQNRWAAARFGPAAELIHPDGERTSSVPELWAELCERIGLESSIDPSRCEADEQAAVAGAHEATAGLVARTLA
jgi:glutamate---cysteine ligase / carboxylate-amine ligase